MALANLNINVNANVSNVVNAMADVKAVTHANMLGSSAAVTDFQKNFVKDSAIIQQQSKAMGGELESSSSTIQKAAQVSSESIGDIKTSANASLAGVKELSKGMDAAGAKIKEAIGPEAAAQVKGTTERIKEFVETRIIIAAVGIALGAVAATIATVGYAAYKAAGFLTGLLTGSSYKSKNIDALIEANKEVLDLQHSLQMTSQDATALNDALNRIGVNKSDITTVASNIESKLRGDTSELDRLGVGYKGSNGVTLETTTILQNAKSALDQYTEGWDRNQAAIAMGFGTYDQISNYLKVNQEELQASKTRLNEYNLLIGPETQEYVAQYQRAQREFNNELKLMGDGFKRVYADQVMPAYITFQNALKDGWPQLVTGTRHILAAFTSMGYGIKMVIDMMWDVVSGNFKALGTLIGGFAAAIDQARQGNFKGAKDILIDTGKAGVEQLKGIGTQIVKDAENNLKAMKLAQGTYNVDNAPAGGPGSAKKKGKTFTPPPTPAAVEAAVEPVDDGYIAAWNRLQDKIAQMNPTLTDYQREIQKVNDEYDTLVGKYPEHKTELESNRKVMLAQVAAVKAHKDGLEEMYGVYELVVQDQEKAMQAMSDTYQEVLMMQKEVYNNSPFEGMKAGLDSYKESVKSLGDQFKDLAMNSMQQMENALTNFVMSGKINFKDFANSIISDLIRIQIRESITGPLSGALNGMIRSMFNNSPSTGATPGADGVSLSSAGYQWSGPSFDVGTNYVPYDMIAQVHKGEAIIPAYENKNSGATNLTVNVVNQSGQSVKAKEGGTSFDGKSMVKTIVLEAMDTDPSFRWAMRGAA